MQIRFIEFSSLRMQKGFEYIELHVYVFVDTLSPMIMKVKLTLYERN